MITNGCDFFPDGDWGACCDAHDIAFQQSGSTVLDWFNANVDLVSCIAQHNIFVSIIVGIGVFGGSWIVFNFKNLKGKTLWEVITGKRYNGPQG